MREPVPRTDVSKGTAETPFHCDARVVLVLLPVYAFEFAKTDDVGFILVDERLSFFLF